MRILVIEDDAALAEALADSLRAQGWQTDCCGEGEEGLYLARMDAYDILLVDRMLPGLDGTELVRCLRQEGHMAPVLMMTALDAVGDRVTGLDAGADDYLPKPFATAELLARVRALARRPAALQTSAVPVGDVRLDTVQRRLYGPSGECGLSKRECALLGMLAANLERTVPRETLLVRVWGLDSNVENGNLDNYVHLVRRRLSSVGSHLRLVTVRGVGYSLKF